MNKFNYILNDLALSNLITRCLYSENADCSDKEELENQIKLIQQENKQLKDNWIKLKDYIMNDINSRSQCKVVEYEDGRKVLESTSSGYILMQDKSTTAKEILHKIQELEGSDNNGQ